jgi:hypothetical protein
MAKKSFNEPTERQILALAIQLEEEDSRVYGDFAEGLREAYRRPPTRSMKCKPRNRVTGNGNLYFSPALW